MGHFIFSLFGFKRIILRNIFQRVLEGPSLGVGGGILDSRRALVGGCKALAFFVWVPVSDPKP